MDHAFSHAHFRMHDSNLLVKPVYVKVLIKRESMYRVVAYLSFDSCIVMNLSSLKDIR